MKLRFYIDLLNDGVVLQLKDGLIARTQPFVKNEKYRRIAFDVTIPDEYLFKVDLVAPEVSQMEEVK